MSSASAPAFERHRPIAEPEVGAIAREASMRPTPISCNASTRNRRPVTRLPPKSDTVACTSPRARPRGLAERSTTCRRFLGARVYQRVGDAIH